MVTRADGQLLNIQVNNSAGSGYDVRGKPVGSSAWDG